MIQQAPRLLFFGDSLVNGVGDTDQRGGWVGRLCAEAAKIESGLRHCNLGIGGETSAELARRWLGEALPRWKQEHDVRVIFQFGTNDTKLIDGRQMLSQAQSLVHAGMIMREAASRWPVLWAGPPPLSDASHSARNKALSQAYAALAREQGIAYFDSFSALGDSSLFLSDIAAADGVHPGPAGYAEWGRVIAAWPDWWFHPSGR